MLTKAKVLTKMCTLLPIVPMETFVAMRYGKFNAYTNN
jgi:hypothetical protein